MVRLPGGQIAGITSVRARYHAGRLNQCISSKSSTARLHPLIDIIFGNTVESPAHWKQNYRFSGYTLSDLPRLAGWSDTDKHHFNEWLHQDIQTQEINNARIRIANDPYPFKARGYPYPDRLYSAFRQRLESIPLNRASPGQWRRTLLNMKRQGIREEEIRWSGILDYLSPTQQSTTRIISRNDILEHVDFSSIRLALTNELVCTGDDRPGFRPTNKYEYLSLHGGSDYREWWVTLPDYPGSHFTAHSYERNVLAHARTKTRRDINGRKLLFIEELQSDWHQSGGRNAPVAPFRKEWAALTLKLLLMYAIDRHYDGIAWTDGDIQRSRYHKPLGAILRIYDKTIPACLQRLGADHACSLGHTAIQTRETRLRAIREHEKWRITDRSEKFRTPGRYTMHEAIEFIARHSKNISLTVPVFHLSTELRRHVLEKGLTRFG